ncbi:MAG TPA: 3-hydroxyacyl-CoA dehydrogenase NAD-binding domain-containing protein [Elusimicrobiota bacterium]|nr:3-hydroxyacyl-CoA dehydrogenase NAD-binding domain-containing protein [Elusimicrobiota bacterium]
MIQRVAVVGAGTMGAGIAQLCAQSGFGVKVHDPLPAALAALPGRLRKSLDAAVLKGKLGTQQADRAFHSVSPAASLEDLAGADLVVEAAPENLTLKRELFEKLSRICPDAVLATNTSSLSVAEIMGRAASPERTLGVHFFNPPVAMKLVEMVRTGKTSPEAFREAFDFVLMGLKRTPVDVKDVPGFIVNRVMRPYYVTCQGLAGASASFARIDEACRTLGGVPMGPFELMDLIGLDTNLAITKSIYEALGRPERFAPPALQQALVDRGMTGRKAGKGFYLYADGKPQGENPEALSLRAAAGVSDGPDAWARLRAALIAEAERVVDEGTASGSDVDIAIRLAMNFPKGPLEWRKESTAA